MKKKARIWVWWRGTISRITLEQNKPITMRFSGPTEEGWEYEEEVYELIGDIIHQSTQFGGGDCDGRIDHFQEMTAEVGHTYLQEYKNTVVELPIWERKRSHQRDWSAEAANY